MAQHILTDAGFSLATAVFTAAREATQRTANVWKALQHRKAVRNLAEYDARMLKDIGLVPTDVLAALDQHWASDPSRHLNRVAAGRRTVRILARNAGANLPDA